MEALCYYRSSISKGSRILLKTLISSTACLGMTAVAPPTQAQSWSDATQEGSAFRLSVSAPLFSYTSTSSETDGVEISDKRSSFGLPAETGSIGLGSSPNRNFNFGLELALGSQSSQTEVDGTAVVDQKVGLFGVSPYIEGVFSDTGFARGFVRGQVTFASATTTTTDPMTDADFESELGLFRVAVGGGAQLFPVEQFSVDLRLDLAYASVTASNDALEDDLESSGVGVIGVFGLSGWFGRVSRPSSSEEMVMPAEEPEATIGTRQVGSVQPSAIDSDDAPSAGSTSRDGVLTLLLSGNVRVRVEPPEQTGGDASVMFLVPQSTSVSAPTSSLPLSRSSDARSSG